MDIYEKTMRRKQQQQLLRWINGNKVNNDNNNNILMFRNFVEWTKRGQMTGRISLKCLQEFQPPVLSGINMAFSFSSGFGSHDQSIIILNE